jgi:hypothetical protein
MVKFLAIYLAIVVVMMALDLMWTGAVVRPPAGKTSDA